MTGGTVQEQLQSIQKNLEDYRREVKAVSYTHLDVYKRQVYSILPRTAMLPTPARTWTASAKRIFCCLLYTSRNAAEHGLTADELINCMTVALVTYGFGAYERDYRKVFVAEARKIWKMCIRDRMTTVTVTYRRMK